LLRIKDCTLAHDEVAMVKSIQHYAKIDYAESGIRQMSRSARDATPRIDHVRRNVRLTIIVARTSLAIKVGGWTRSADHAGAAPLPQTHPAPAWSGYAATANEVICRDLRQQQTG
jgi:hypothetical protein